MKPLLLGYDAAERPLFIQPEDTKTHWYVNGGSGSGKSKFVQNVTRQHIKNGHGATVLDPHGPLVDETLAYCAHIALDRQIDFLDLSNPKVIISCNPFQRAPHGDVSVQVQRRISATMHAWGVDNSDNTPTLARILWLFYTVMLELNLTLPEIEHLVYFNEQVIRGTMIERITSPLIQREWRELLELKIRDRRDEILSAKNRLFKFLTCQTLCRFMGLPGRTLNVQQVMDEEKVVLIKAAQSDDLSEEGARTFLSLLVTEYFETALRRKGDSLGQSPKPHFLIIDEFQTCISPALSKMLDQVRKYSLYLLLCSQRLSHLDDDILDAVLTNCRIKAVFGGLSAKSARIMAEELFIGELDSKKIKLAVYQTKFWPKYSRDKVYTRGTTTGSTTSHSSSSGGGETSGQTLANGSSTSMCFDDWFSFPQLNGTRTTTSTTVVGQNSGRSTSWGESASDSSSFSESESVADIPIFIPMPFSELSNIQYYTTEEQLVELTGALKEQFTRHCFVKIQGQKTQPMLVPFIDDIRSFRDSAENLEWYLQWQWDRAGALPVAEIDRLLDQRKTALLQTTRVGPPIDDGLDIGNATGVVALPTLTRSHHKRVPQRDIWNRGNNKIDRVKTE